MSAEITRAAGENSPSTLVDVLSSSAAATIYREYEADLVVTQKEPVADGVAVLTLADANGRELPAWTPGAHIDLVLTDPALARQYSLCSNPADRHAWRIGVLREAKSRGGSQFIHDVLKAGDMVRVRGPRNHFSLVDAPRYVFIAGGIGITPILPMVAAVHATGADWQLLYGGRRRASMAFLNELAAYGDRVRIYPEDEEGLLPLASVLSMPQEGTLAYCCGPEPLLVAVEGWCASWPAGRGWATFGGTLHVDASYLLLHDNALDLTHFPFVHPELSTHGYRQLPPPLRVEVSETSVTYQRIFPPVRLADWQVRATGLSPDQEYEQRESGTFVSPGFHIDHMDIVIPAADGTSGQVYEKVYIRAFTPEGPTSTHVFWQVARNFATDDVAVTEDLRAVHERMQLEDKPVLEAIQAHERDRRHEPGITVNADIATIKARQIVETMLAR